MRPLVVDTLAQAPQPRARRVRHFTCCGLLHCCGLLNLGRLPHRLFYGHWPDKNGRGLTTLIVEQVSHHPPITAYYISNASRKIALQGHSAQKTSFSGELLALWRCAPDNAPAH